MTAERLLETAAIHRDCDPENCVISALLALVGRARLLGALDTIDKAANLLNEGTYDHDRTECVCSPCLALRVLRHG